MTDKNTMNYRLSVSLLLLMSFSFIKSSLAVVMIVGGDKAVSVMRNGKEFYLNKGDVLDIQNQESWKRNIVILESSVPGVEVGPAVIGDQTFQVLKNDGHLKAAKEPRTYRVTKAIRVIGPDEKTYVLQPGDTFDVGMKNGWKRAITINSPSNGFNDTRGFIGDATYSNYLHDDVVLPLYEEIETKAHKEIKNYDDLDAFIKSYVEKNNNEDFNDEEIFEMAEEDSTPVQKDSCPADNKTIKLDRTISILPMAGKVDSVPRDSIVKVIKTEKGACYFKILKLPNGSTLSLSDFPQFAGSYPINFKEGTFHEVDEPSQVVGLEKGSTFKLSNGVKLTAIGRRTGKSYPFDANDEISIVGRHKNGSYIVKRNGEPYEYRVSASALDEYNELGLVNFDLEKTAATIIEDDGFHVATKVVEQEIECGGDQEIEDGPLDERWESCRERSVTSKSGKKIKPNNYLEEVLGLSDVKSDLALDDNETRNMAICIGQSMRHGTSRNTNPSCAKDAKGRHIKDSVRTSKKNSSGKHIGWRLKDPVPRACASKNLATGLAKSYLSAAKCLGLDPKEFFPVLNHESHFQPNAVSPSYALGVGQIVANNYTAFYSRLNQAKDYIEGNHNLYKKMQQYRGPAGYEKFESLNSKRPVNRYTAYFLTDIADKVKGNDPNCSGLKDLYKNPVPIPREVAKSARKAVNYLRNRENERLCKPRNPQEGFFISMIYYQKNKKYFTNFVRGLSDAQPKPMSNDQINTFATIFARWSYNGGLAGIQKVLSKFVGDLKSGRVKELTSNGSEKSNTIKARYLSDLSSSELKRYFSHYVKYNYPSRSSARKNEVAKYVPGVGGTGGIDGDLKQTEKQGSGTCGQSF